MTNFIYLLAHLAVLAVLVSLWRRAPDNVQRTFLAVAASAMLVYLFGDALAVYGIDNKRGGTEVMGISALWEVTSVAGALSHAALLIYFARQGGGR